MTAAFGPIKTRSQVVDAVIATLQEWQTEYLAEVERQHGLAPASLPLMQAWERSTDAMRLRLGTDLPAVLVRCPGLAEDPVERKAGTDATWTVRVTVAASGGSQVETEDLVDLYTAAFRALLNKRRTLGGFAISTTWIDERYDDLGQPNDRDTIGAGTAIYKVEVSSVVSTKGPSAPPLSDPYGTVRGAAPTATEVNTTLEPIGD